MGYCGQYSPFFRSLRGNSTVRVVVGVGTFKLSNNTWQRPSANIAHRVAAQYLTFFGKSGEQDKNLMGGLLCGVIFKFFGLWEVSMEGVVEDSEGDDQ